METDDKFVAVVLVLVGARFDWEVGEGSCDPWQKEVDHGPQLFQSVLEGITDEENSLLTEKYTKIHKLQSTKMYGQLYNTLNHFLVCFTHSVADTVPSNLEAK